MTTLDPEKKGFLENSTEESQKQFRKKLNSGLVGEKAVARYENALANVKANGGRDASKELLSELSKARKSVNALYNNRVDRNEYQALKKDLEKGVISESDFTEDQRKLFDRLKNTDERRSTKARERRAARGLGGKGATLEGQKTRLNESFDAYTRRIAKEGYANWLKYNEGKGAAAGLLEATPKQQASLWWDTLPELEKEKWGQELREPYDHNRAIIKKYHDAGELVPNDVAANELKQLHHIYPRAMGGGHFPSQVSTVTGDAWSARGSEHGLLHDPRLDQFYKRFEGQNWMPFDFNDPNIITRASGSPEINKQGLSYLDSIAKGLMDFGDTPGGKAALKVGKKVGKVAAKALPIAGYGLAADASVDYAKSGNPILSAISGASAIPVLGDVFGIPLAAAELGGLGINALIDEYNISNRKKREGEMNLFDYQPSGGGGW